MSLGNYKVLKHTITTLLIGISLLFCTQIFAFQFQDTTGKIHQLSDYKGRWVIVNFWATWCPPCLKEIPDLIALHGNRQDIMIIGVAMDMDDPKMVLDFAQSMAINYPIVLGNRQLAAQIDEISLLPSTYFYDPNGEPAARQLGIVSRDSIEQFIASKSPQK